MRLHSRVQGSYQKELRWTLATVAYVARRRLARDATADALYAELHACVTATRSTMGAEGDAVCRVAIDAWWQSSQDGRAMLVYLAECGNGRAALRTALQLLQRYPDQRLPTYQRFTAILGPLRRRLAGYEMSSDLDALERWDRRFASESPQASPEFPLERAMCALIRESLVSTPWQITDTAWCIANDLAHALARLRPTEERGPSDRARALAFVAALVREFVPTPPARRSLLRSDALLAAEPLEPVP